jgi:hypothetical protein
VPFLPNDRTVLRELAQQVAEAAARPIMAERRELWLKHNRLKRVRPIVLVFPEGSWRELLPKSTLLCEEEDAREIEWQLRLRLYYRDRLPDDSIIEREWKVPKAIADTGWGLEPRQIPSPVEVGAWAFDPVIETGADLKKLRFPEVIYDDAETNRRYAEAQELFGDILDVQLKGIAQVAFHMMTLYARRRGLERAMLDMCEEPQMIHDAMAFFEEGYRRLMKQYQEMNLFSLNNNGTYHSSGGFGYTTELPAAGGYPNWVLPGDMWASAESQEMAQVGPEMHEEFALQYEKRLLAPFGLTGYGCCEDLTDKLDLVLQVPNIRRISISPFADVERCAERLGDKAIFSWKPHPSHLVGEFDAARIREYIRHTVEVTRGCVLEMILKDTHTCEGHPERFTQWIRIAREAVEG